MKYLQHLTILCLCGLFIQPAMAKEAKHVALVGTYHAVNAFEKYVAEPAGCLSESFTDGSPSVHNYKNYDIVIFLEKFLAEKAMDDAVWNSGDNLDTVRDYVKEGGKIIIIGPAWPHNSEEYSESARNLTKYDDLFGFSRYPRTYPVNPVSIETAGRELFSNATELDLVAELTQCVDNITTAEVLATVIERNGTSRVFATRNTFGKGEVYFFGTSPFRLARDAAKSGETNFENNFVPYAAALQKLISIK